MDVGHIELEFDYNGCPVCKCYNVNILHVITAVLICAAILLYFFKVILLITGTLFIFFFVHELICCKC